MARTMAMVKEGLVPRYRDGKFKSGRSSRAPRQSAAQRRRDLKADKKLIRRIRASRDDLGFRTWSNATAGRHRKWNDARLAEEGHQGRKH